jgi:hypothetical protein
MRFSNSKIYTTDYEVDEGFGCIHFLKNITGRVKKEFE